MNFRFLIWDFCVWSLALDLSRPPTTRAHTSFFPDVLTDTDFTGASSFSRLDSAAAADGRLAVHRPFAAEVFVRSRHNTTRGGGAPYTHS